MIFICFVLFLATSVFILFFFMSFTYFDLLVFFFFFFLLSVYALFPGAELQGGLGGRYSPGPGFKGARHCDEDFFFFKTTADRARWFGPESPACVHNTHMLAATDDHRAFKQTRPIMCPAPGPAVTYSTGDCSNMFLDISIL